MGLRSEAVKWQSYYGLYLQWTNHLIWELQPSKSIVDITDISVELGPEVIQTLEILGNRMDDQAIKVHARA